jgi:hypothetical protein
MLRARRKLRCQPASVRLEIPRQLPQVPSALCLCRLLGGLRRRQPPRLARTITKTFQCRHQAADFVRAAILPNGDVQIAGRQMLQRRGRIAQRPHHRHHQHHARCRGRQCGNRNRCHGQQARRFICRVARLRRRDTGLGIETHIRHGVANCRIAVLAVRAGESLRHATCLPARTRCLQRRAIRLVARPVGREGFHKRLIPGAGIDHRCIRRIDGVSPRNVRLHVTGCFGQHIVLPTKARHGQPRFVTAHRLHAGREIPERLDRWQPVRAHPFGRHVHPPSHCHGEQTKPQRGRENKCER